MKPAGIKVLVAFLTLFACSSAWAVSFSAATTTDITPYAPASGAFADFNGDGKQDAALPLSSGTSHYLRIMTGDGLGGFPSQSDLVLPDDLAAATASGSVVAADLNGDGITDLAATNTGADSVSIFIGNGDGTFDARVDYPVGAAPKAIAVGDFKGSGIRNDLAVVNSTDRSIAILLNDGTGVMTAQDVGSWPSAPDAISALAVGDLNGDDIDDVAIARNSVGKVTIFRGNGIGTFQTGIDLSVGAGPIAVAAADFNNDGIIDLAALNGIDATISLVKGNSIGIFSVNSTFSVADPADFTADPVYIIAVDLNRDGITDLAVANKAKNTISVLTGAGDATFLPADAAASFGTGSAPTAVASGELNGGGNDLLSTSSVNDSYSLLLNSSPAIAGMTVTPITYDFGSFQLGHLSYIATHLTIANGGSAPLAVSSMSITGANSSEFQVRPEYGTCGTTTPTIGPGSSCTVELRFLPQGGEGAKISSLNITGNSTVNPAVALPLSGRVIPFNAPFTIYLSFIGRGSGRVDFSPISSTCTSSCTVNAPEGLVSLVPSPDSGMYFYGWSGCDYISSGSCQANLESDKRISANFGMVARQVKLDASWPMYKATAAEAYASSSNGDTIMLGGTLLNENLILNLGVNISLKGGYDSGFTAQGGATALRSITVAAGSAVIDNIILK